MPLLLLLPEEKLLFTAFADMTGAAMVAVTDVVEIMPPSRMLSIDDTLVCVEVDQGNRGVQRPHEVYKLYSLRILQR